MPLRNLLSLLTIAFLNITGFASEPICAINISERKGATEAAPSSTSRCRRKQTQELQSEVPVRRIRADHEQYHQSCQGHEEPQCW